MALKLAIDNEEMKAEIAQTTSQAENLIVKLFPERVAVFKRLLASPDFCGHGDINKELQSMSLEEVQPNLSPTGAPGNLSDNTDSNDLPKKSPENIADASSIARKRRQISVLTPHFCQMESDFQLLKLWLQYSIPKVEDGNNFGVSVIEHLIDGIKYAIDIAQGFLACSTVWTEDRAKIVKKAVKHPQVPDYKEAVQELDEYHLQRLRRHCQDLYRSYMVAYDVLIKNIDKIISPRGGNTINSVYG